MQPRTKDMPGSASRARRTNAISEESGDSGQQQSRQLNRSATASSSGEQATSEIASDEIARCAYFHWEAEGRPDGKDLEHWIRAKDELEKARP